MEKSNKRGKIPQSDWPMIMGRYEAGETLASIARTYDCSPPAISYVVSRSRARHADADSPAALPGIAESQLLKAGEPGAGGAAKPQSAPAPSNGANPDASVARPDNLADHNPVPSPIETNGFARNGSAERNGRSPGMLANPITAPRNGTSAPPPAEPAPVPGHTNGTDQRRTLHLSLGDGASGNGGSHQPDLLSVGRPAIASPGQPPVAAGGQSLPDASHNGASPAGFSEIRPAFNEPVRRNGSDSPARKGGGGTFIDKELRARVDTDIAAFLAAFDAALVEDTQESRSTLREATDRLLRAGARTRIELERLEARLPLPSSDNRGSGEPAWRYR